MVALASHQGLLALQDTETWLYPAPGGTALSSLAGGFTASSILTPSCLWAQSICWAEAGQHEGFLPSKTNWALVKALTSP